MNVKASASKNSARVKDDASRSSLNGEFHNFLLDMEDLVKQTASVTGEDFIRVKEELGQRISAAKKSIEDMGGAVTQEAYKGAVATNAYVHDKPWQVIGASAAVAFLLGFVLARR
jgi:ElaB/YqjD/DUF883 family membrane-anchored ribosome-binding protein